MLLRLQGYDCTIVYRPGKEMLLADTLSRYAPLSSNEIELDVTIRHVRIEDTRKASLQELTRTDPLLKSLAETIINGWPEDPKDIPEALRPYWNHRDTMTVEDGIILCGEAILVPSAERGEILQQIHEGHQGITKIHNRYMKDTRGSQKASYAHATVCTGQVSIRIYNAWSRPARHASASDHVNHMLHSRPHLRLQDHGKDWEQTCSSLMVMTS